MFRLVSPAVIAVVLCSALAQNASSDSDSTITCQRPTCPQGQYCRMSLGECRPKLGSSHYCEDIDACKDGYLCTDGVCYYYGLPTIKCYGEQCYENQYCSRRYGKCMGKINENWTCELGSNSCKDSLKCVKYKGGPYCTDMKTTT